MLTLTPMGNLIEKQREYFATGNPKKIEFRITQLKKLKQAINHHKQAVLDALKADLNKPKFEGYFDIISINEEIDYALKNIKSWVKPKSVKTPLTQFPASAKIYPDPLGVVLIIGPWNYPFSLVLTPLVGAITAGNCAILKPSELAPHTSRVIAQLIQETFAPVYINVVEGGIETSQQLLAEKFDHIFFTGGTRVGKIIMEAASKHLTPVTLELGGKSPCIVDTDINITETSKRITWGKFLNSGQTCIAPDYLLVQKSIKIQLVQNLKKQLQEFYGDDPATSPDYARIINDQQFERLKGLLADGKIIIGGQTEAATRYIAPTVIEEVSLDSPVMQEEIFGPILPIIEYETIDEAIALINCFSKPLALYLFSNDKVKQQQVLQQTSSGGVCINDTVLQVGVIDLPFGGVGNSGIGNYHGFASFKTFSHYKSVLQRSFWFDLNWRYPPYQKKLKQLQRLFKS